MSCTGQLKYVVFKDGIGTESILFIPSSVAHKDVTIANAEPVRAGFVTIAAKDGLMIAKCYGSSMSLGLGSDKEADERLARIVLNDTGSF